MSGMNRRGFLKFLSTATAVIALPAIGAAPAPGLAMPGEYCDMRFDRPIAAPPGSRFQRCWFSAEASAALPADCDFFSCFFAGPVVISGVCENFRDNHIVVLAGHDVPWFSVARGTP